MTENRLTSVSQEAGGASTARTALIAGVVGLLSVAAYLLVAALPHGSAPAPVAASIVGPSIAASSVALYLLLASERPTLAGLLAAIANVAAGALLTAMLLVQIAVAEVAAGLSPAEKDAFKRVEFALDLSWDVFLVAGTILFGLAMLRDSRFGRWFGLPGIVLGVALYAFNFATFPTPPANAGLVDLGPAVGLWYAAVWLQVLRLRGAREPARATADDLVIQRPLSGPYRQPP